VTFPVSAELTAPDVRYHKSFLACMAEFQAAGLLDGWAAELDLSPLQSPDGFADYVAEQHARRTRGADPADGRVPESSLWWVEGEEFLGRISVRHRLNSALETYGGHIGYAVRPSAQGKGHGTAMLRAILPIAYALGIDDALLTTSPANHASRRVIERSGGRLVREVPGRCYYRLRTVAA
jgi:predicted acetyltransferase